ncbi:hypothetical protein ACFQX9_30145 [Bradyrhizobium sp. GCM10028915]
MRNAVNTARQRERASAKNEQAVTATAQLSSNEDLSGHMRIDTINVGDLP